MPRLHWIEIVGFRAFSVRQRLEFSRNLSIVWGGNSQGKTSFAEAIEFFLAGTVARRELLGGEKAEYDGTLRCAHHPASEEVSVAAALEDAEGVLHEVKRTLVRDFGRGQDCESDLIIDGKAAQDLESLGFRTAEPPLRAPVLMQHSIRFALSSKPSERMTYFKSLLETTDLDSLTGSIDSALKKAAAADEDAVDADYAKCLANEGLAPFLIPLERGVPSAEQVEESFREALKFALTELGNSDDLSGWGISDLASLVSSSLEERAERQYDFATWRPGPAPDLSQDPSLTGCHQYNEAVSDVDSEVQRLTNVFISVLNIPALAELSEPTDCPVCAAEGSLTPERVEELKRVVASSATFRAAQAAADSELRELDAAVRLALEALEQLTPSSAKLSDEDLSKFETDATRLLGESIELASARREAQVLEASAISIKDELIALQELLKVAKERVRSSGIIEIEDLSSAYSRTSRGVKALSLARRETIAAAAPTMTRIRDLLQERSGGSAGLQIVRLLHDPSRATTRVRRRRARQEAIREYATALRDMEKAKLDVLTSKFAGMSDEIVKWWKLLRPDEPVSFHEAAPRGQGKRSVSMRAKLTADTNVEFRDALGVFSDSQLNALGLAAFLARAVLQESPLVLLDDPVQSGDEQHRDTFIDLVVPELLACDVQVIVTTFDYKLNQYLSNAEDVDGFTISLDTPGIGSIVLRGNDTAHALLNDAKGFIQETPALRATGAGRLRVAAEAVAKEILVHKRLQAGERASLADYSGWALEKLEPSLLPYLTDDRERGRWKNIRQRLNPGAHHDAPPPKATLKMAYDQLIASYKLHVPINRGKP